MYKTHKILLYNVAIYQFICAYCIKSYINVDIKKYMNYYINIKNKSGGAKNDK